MIRGWQHWVRFNDQGAHTEPLKVGTFFFALQEKLIDGNVKLHCSIKVDKLALQLGEVSWYFLDQQLKLVARKDDLGGISRDDLAL